MKNMKIIFVGILFLFLFTSCGRDDIEESGFSDITIEEVILNKAYGNDSTNHYAIRIGGQNKDRIYVFKPDDGITVYNIRYRSPSDLILLTILSILLGMLLTFGFIGVINSN